MPANRGYNSTGRKASMHQGGRGDYKGKTRPGYPKGPEGTAKTVMSPYYPRDNFAGSSSRGTSKQSNMGGGSKY